MKEFLEQYASYNLWANERLLNAVLLLDLQQQTKNVASSFPSLYKTFLHIFYAENAWWQRVKLAEQVVAVNESLYPAMKDVAEGLTNQSKLWEDWVHKSTEAGLQHVFAYYSGKKEYFKNPVWKTLLHLFNHGTYHRGQIVTILHNLQVDKIPGTDFIVWSRRK